MVLLAAVEVCSVGALHAVGHGDDVDVMILLTVV